MFFVINKSKILSYVLAVCTVVILFMLASSGSDENSISTSVNVLETNEISNEVIDNSQANSLQNSLDENDMD